MSKNICWHCGETLLPKEGVEKFCVLNKETDNLELKTILHTSCYAKLRDSGLI